MLEIKVSSLVFDAVGYEVVIPPSCFLLFTYTTIMVTTVVRLSLMNVCNGAVLGMYEHPGTEGSTFVLKCNWCSTQ